MDGESNGTTVPQVDATETTQSTVEGKGKGKAPAQAQPMDSMMEDDDDDEEEEEEEEEPVSAAATEPYRNNADFCFFRLLPIVRKTTNRSVHIRRI